MLQQCYRGGGACFQGRCIAAAVAVVLLWWWNLATTAKGTVAVATALPLLLAVLSQGRNS